MMNLFLLSSRCNWWDWSGVDYLWIIVMFLSALWTLILTASIAETVMEWHISPNLMKIWHISPNLGWPEGEDIFSKIFIFGWTRPFRKLSFSNVFLNQNLTMRDIAGCEICLVVSGIGVRSADADCQIHICSRNMLAGLAGHVERTFCWCCTWLCPTGGRCVCVCVCVVVLQVCCQADRWAPQRSAWGTDGACNNQTGPQSQSS